ncbi:MAG: DEAD/DEAH box helicase family protein [Coprobacillus sp.]|nr:DEAD/DEAH box helicase family protein [Coprobacillus sp.]
MRRKKGKGVITNGRDVYEQLSLFNETIIGNAEREESTEIFTVKDEWRTGEGIEEFSNRNGYSTNEDIERGSIGIEKEFYEFFGRSQLQSTDSSISSGEDYTMDISDTIVQSTNFRIENKDSRIGSREKFKRNMKALICINQRKKYLIHDEQEILSFYSGWGGLPQVFDEGNKEWFKEREQLKDIVTINQYQQMKSSVLTSFYTPYEIIEGMYKILRHIGFNGGNILDPSMGTGNFFGLMPENMMDSSLLYGVEIDEISGQIAQYLYPNSLVQITGYEKTSFPNDFFDLIISNIPFGRYKLHDLDYNKYNLDIHNYFILKSIDKVRAGGIVAFVTSTNTLDGNSEIRNLVHKKADFLGAIRLPNTTFQNNGANTSVISDIVFFQKKEEYDFTRTHVSWLNREHIENNVYMNQYFIEHPEMICGECKVAKNQYGGYTLVVDNQDLPFSEMIEKVLHHFPKQIYNENQLSHLEVNNNQLQMDLYKYKNNEYFIADGKVYLRQDYQAIEIEKNKGQIKLLIQIKDSVQNMIAIQMKGNKEEEYQGERQTLNQLYDDYVKKYGYINIRKTISILKNDPNYYLLTALEKINTDTKEVTKSDFFFKRTIKPIVEIKSVDNIFDAFHLSLNRNGKVDIEYIETIYHKSQQTIIDELLENKLAYRIPFEESGIEIADEYLSGNVRKKLELAKKAEIRYPGMYSQNVEDLESIQPKWLTADEIEVQLGSVWVPSQYYEEFIIQLFEMSNFFKGRYKLNYSQYTGEWILSDYNKWDVNVTKTWGVPKVELNYMYSQPEYTGMNLLMDIMNSRLPTIRDYWDEQVDGKTKRHSRINQTRTTIARNLADKMKLNFSNWIYSDYKRRTHLEEIYNNTLNNYVERKYDGSHLTFPEMNSSLQLEEYQKNAVFRIMSSRSTLLSQQVGAGKTFEMVTAAMEMKRMELANKCMIVVPNHLVDQWRNEFLIAYPQANILAATTKDFTSKKRNEFIHKIATNDYDAIIIAHSSFKLIPMSNDIMIKQMEKEIEDIEYGLESLKYNEKQNTRYVKLLEKTKKSIEANVQRLTDIPRDNGITFDELGIDYLFVDEAHEFKNLYIYSKMSNVAGVPQTKSQKASDMYMKTSYILENGGGVCFATGTPISNTMAELYNMQRYLQEETLHECGIFCFDAWAKNFGEVVSSLEISIDGSGFTTRERFNKFFNVPELMTMFRQVAEIQTEGMLKKALSESTTGRSNIIPPKHIGGKPNVIVIEPSSELETYIEQIVERSENIHSGIVDPREDNMLKVTTDSKKASIDLRLIDPCYGYIAGDKLDAVITNIYNVWKDYEEDKATQLVFCDSSTPSQNRFNVYDEIKEGLMRLGVPNDEIAYIHEAKTEIQKTKLFNRMKCGSTRILLGSTAKLGAGTNVQDRLIAIHHVDVPWRASDIEQRNGRGFRQGNRYDEIYEFRYVTKKSFDSYSWQMIETKASYMNQLLEGMTSSREIEEDNTNIMSYAEVKAIASGNPLIKEKMEVDNGIKKLQLEKQIFNKEKYSAQRNLIALPQSISNTCKKIARIKSDIPLAQNSLKNKIENIEEWFTVSIKDQIFKNMKEAGDVLFDISNQIERNPDIVHIGQFCGFEFGISDKTLIIIGSEREYRMMNEVHQIGRINFVRMLKVIQGIPETYENEKLNLEMMIKQQQHYQEMVEAIYPEEERLVELLERQRALNDILNVSHQSQVVLDEEESLEQE